MKSYRSSHHKRHTCSNIFIKTNRCTFSHEKRLFMCRAHRVNLFWWLEPAPALYLIFSHSPYIYRPFSVYSLFNCATSNTPLMLSPRFVYHKHTLHICADISCSWLTEWCLHSNHYLESWIYLHRKLKLWRSQLFRSQSWFRNTPAPSQNQLCL